MNNRKLTALAAGAALLLAAPAILPEYPLRILIGILLWTGLAQSWNVIGGYTGYLNFGHGAFYGIGAYATALGLTQLHLPFFVTLIMGAALSAVLAIIMGGPTLRLKGAYFAIATWAFGAMMRELFKVLEWTGGDYGVPITTPHNDVLIYYWMLGACLLTLGVVWWVMERSAFGYRVRAIREHEVAAETLGIDTNRVKLTAFVLSAIFPAILGGINAYWISFINPNSVFGDLVTDQMVVMVLLGGLGNFWGPVVGAGALWIINRTLWTYWGDSVAYLVLIGIAVCLVVLYLPDGLVGLWEGRRSRGGWRENLASILGRRGVSR